MQIQLFKNILVNAEIKMNYINKQACCSTVHWSFMLSKAYLMKSVSNICFAPAGALKKKKFLHITFILFQLCIFIHIYSFFTVRNKMLI